MHRPNSLCECRPWATNVVPWITAGLQEYARGFANVKLWPHTHSRMWMVTYLVLHQPTQKLSRDIPWTSSTHFTQTNNATIWILTFQIQQCSQNSQWSILQWNEGPNCFFNQFWLKEMRKSKCNWMPCQLMKGCFTLFFMFPS